MSYSHGFGAPGSTSEVLRKILVAGAVVAALSVVACQKPAGVKSLTDDSDAGYDAKDDTKEG